MSSFLNRYTSLPYLIEILMDRRLTMLSPKSWEDRNDSFFIEGYKAEKKLKLVLALCFMTTRERFHHWKCFADGSSGVCIEFSRQKLLKMISQDQEFLTGLVNYRLIRDVKRDPPKVDSWPFLKRSAFQDEGEFRVICAGKSAHPKIRAIPINVACINRVTLSPWLSEDAANRVAELIRAIPRWGRLKIKRSTLLENSTWREAIATPLQAT